MNCPALLDVHSTSSVGHRWLWVQTRWRQPTLDGDVKTRPRGVYVAITYRVHDFENFDENFVQGTTSPLLKSHIPLDGSVSLFKYLPTELKRIWAKDLRETPTEREDCRNTRPLSEKDSNFCQNGLNFVLASAFFSEALQDAVITKNESISLTKHPCLCPRLIAASKVLIM